MTKIEIQKLAEYVKDLEEALYEFDLDRSAMDTEYAKIYKTIERLMQDTFEAKDRETKAILAALEMKLRKCKDCIERRLRMRN